MNIKKYIKNIIYDLINDESGQYYPITSGQLGWAGYGVEKPSSTGSTNIIRYNPYATGSTNIIRTAQPKTTYTPPVGGVAQPQTVAQSTIPALSAALGYSYQPAYQSEYTPQQYNVNLPSIDWGFNPTAEQRGGWQTQATATAAQEIDPQLLAIKAALDQYLTQGQVQRAELNPRYTNQSLAIANVIQNSVKQEAINNAIKRGAEQSGWLPSALMQAGQLESEQRGDVEAQRNTDLNALAALEAQQTQATGEQNVALEKLRGQRTTTALSELENQAWERANQEKLNQWNAALGGEQLRASAYGENAANMLAGYQTQAGVAQSEADRQLQAAIAQTNQANTQWEQQYTTSQDLYQKQLAAAQAAQTGVKRTPLGYVQGIPYYSVDELNTLYRTYGLGGYAQTTTGSNDELTAAILRMIGG